jgi:hypothetical protein
MSEKLARNQAKAIKSLLELITIQEAADQVGVYPRIIHRWMDEPDFKQDCAWLRELCQV